MINKVQIKTTCPCCQQNHFITVDIKDYEKWQNGELIQNAFPYLSAAKRELLITGICPTCWDTLMTTEED